MPEELLGDSSNGGNESTVALSEAREGSDIEGPAAARMECLKTRHVHSSSMGVGVKFP